MASEFLDKSGLTYLWGKLKDKFAPKVHTHAFDQITPIASKTFTGVIGTANNWANATFFFGTVMPTDFYALWSIKYRVEAVAAGETSARAMYDICIIGNRDTYSAYSCWNAIENTSYYPIYYHVLYRAKSAGISAGYGHALGERLYSSWNATTVANARTINVDVYECVNCTFTFFDSMLKYAEIPGTGGTNYSTYTEFNATSQGLQETGDANTTDDPISYPGAKSGSVGIWSTSMSMQNADGLLENICTASDGTVTSGNRTTAKTKIANTHGFQVGGKIYYNGSTYAANTNLGNLYNSCGLFDSRYSFNTELVANSLTPYQMVYLVGTIHDDGLFYFDTVWWTQTPTDTGKVYILVGGCYDSSTSYCRISLYQHNPWFTYNGSYLIQLDTKIWTAYQKPSTGIPKTDLASAVQTSLGKADSAYQKPSGGIPATDLASGVQTNLGLAATAYQKPSGGIPSTDLAESYYLASNPSGYTSNNGTVTSVRVQATSPVQSSTSTAQSASLNTTISLASGYGDTQNPYGSKDANKVLAAPNGSNGAPTFRALVSADIPYIPKSKISDFPTSMAPTSHASTHALGGTDAIAPSDIGAVRFYASLSDLGFSSNQYLVDIVAAMEDNSVAYLYGGTVYDAPSGWLGDILICKDIGGIASATALGYERAYGDYRMFIDEYAGDAELDGVWHCLTPVRLTISSVSSLPTTVNKAAITSSMVVTECVLSNPLAQTSDWTITTANGSVTVSGSISGTTNITLTLCEALEV